MHKYFRALVVIAVLFMGKASFADPIAVGDLIRFVGSDGTLGGGAFHIDNTADGTGVDFLTFCVQMSQHVDYSNVFRVGAISGFTDDAAGPDPISGATAWIFSSFRSGALSTYSSDEIQAAIWVLEDEWTTNVGQSASLISIAQSQVAGGWVNSTVSVLNLFYTDGGQAQDQLTLNVDVAPLPLPTPEPGTLTLLGVGALALARKRRQMNRA
jgi:hypothetical protein